MGDRDPLHQRSTLGYIFVSLIIALVTALLITPLGRFLTHDVNWSGTRGSNPDVNPPPTSDHEPSGAVANKPPTTSGDEKPSRSQGASTAASTPDVSQPTAAFDHELSGGLPNRDPATSGGERAPRSQGTSIPTSNASQSDRSEYVPRDLAHLQTQQIDPHTCEKPDDAYYGRWGPEVVGPAGSGEMRNPEFLFDARHEERETTINWANGFRGKVPVCFVVDDKGNPTDLQFVQSPGVALEQKLRAKISGWRYKPGTVTQNWRDTPHPISVQIAFEFVFQ